MLQSVSNGTDELSFTKVEQDTDAMPMEVEGGAADGVVYEVKVSGNVYEAMQLVATFENRLTRKSRTSTTTSRRLTKAISSPWSAPSTSATKCRMLWI